MKTISTKCKAWITSRSSVGPDELEKGNRITDLAFVNHDMSTQGWTLAGTATISVNLVDRKTLIDNKVDALKKEASAIRAEATAKVTRIESQIQNLLAICYEEEAPQSKADAHVS